MRNRLNYINPSGETLLKLFDYFRLIHKLENLIIYTTDSIDFLGQTSGQKLVKSIHSVDQLLKHLQLLSGNGLDSVRIESLRKVELFFNATNDLLILKCSRFKLDTILRIYSSLKNKFKLTNPNFRRHLIWLPESSEQITQTMPESDKFHIFRFNWLVDVGKTLLKIIEQTFALNTDIRQLKKIYFEQKLVQPEFGESNLLNELFTVGKFRFMSAALEEYRFKVAHNKIIHLKPPELNEDVFARFKIDIEEPVDTILIRPVYLIVLKQVEPYIYVSQLEDENTTTNADECKDGLTCLKFDTDEITFSHGFHHMSNVSLDD